MNRLMLTVIWLGAIALCFADHLGVRPLSLTKSLALGIVGMGGVNPHAPSEAVTLGLISATAFVCRQILSSPERISHQRRKKIQRRLDNQLARK